MRLHRPFTAEWAEAFRAAIEADARYRAVAVQWKGPLALVLTPAPEFGFPEEIGVELALEGGRCHAAEIRRGEEIAAPMVLSADYATWKSVVKGELDAMQAVAKKAIAVRGSLMTLMMHARTATALLECARAVATDFGVPREDTLA